MRRAAVLLLALCAGCSSSCQDSLLQDSLWGDVRALFGGDDRPVSTGAVAYPTAPVHRQGEAETTAHPY